MSEENKVAINCPPDKIVPALANHFSVNINSFGEFVIIFMYMPPDKPLTATVIQKIIVTPKSAVALHDLIGKFTGGFNKDGGGIPPGSRL